ncbi:MAG: phage/plasmid primase, P4 family [Actinomycetota bacterium]
MRDISEIAIEAYSPAAVAEELVVPPPSNPMAVASMFLENDYTKNGTVLLRHHRNTFHGYDGVSWPEIEEARLRADVYQWLAPAKYWKTTSKLPELVEFEPTQRKIRDLIEAIKAHCHLDGHVAPPAWLDGTTDVDVVPMANGLLSVGTRELLPHTPDYFSPYVLPFDYKPNEPNPSRWLAFLEELWPDEPNSRETLAEIVGYILGGGTALQKIFLVVGPKRSGKGTIGRVLTGLLGSHNVAAPTLSGMTTNFGLQPLIGRPLALVSDARLGTRADASVAVERLLSVSGEDSITIDRKYRDPWTGRLPSRFLVMTNEIPRFTDSSGALASRFVILTMSKSFLGCEDPMLTDRLLAESPGILNWALDGLERLQGRGYFEQPASAASALERLEDLASPVGAFVRDCCVVDSAQEVTKDALWSAWKDWCADQGRDRPGTKAVFFRDLAAAYPGIRAHRRREASSRVHVYSGIGLRGPDDPDEEWAQQGSEPLTTPDQGHEQREPVVPHRTAVRGPDPIETMQTPSSEGVVRGGRGSDALYPSDEARVRVDPASNDPHVVVPGEQDLVQYQEPDSRPSGTLEVTPPWRLTGDDSEAYETLERYLGPLSFDATDGGRTRIAEPIS